MWTTALRQTDIHDPETGESLYVHARIRPTWYWKLRRIKLFLTIVWRVWDVLPDGRNHRLSIKTAWEVSEVAKGLTR